MGTHCSTLVWSIPWTEEPGGQSMGSQIIDVTKVTEHSTQLCKEIISGFLVSSQKCTEEGHFQNSYKT